MGEVDAIRNDVEAAAKKRWTPKGVHERIFLAVEVGGRTQAEVATEFGVSQPTVSRIVRKFGAWRASAKPSETSDLKGVERARLERWVEEKRHQEVYRQAMRLARQMEQPAVIERQGTRGDVAWSDQTKRDRLGGALQCLKTALRASESLGKLSERSRPPEVPEKEPGADRVKVFHYLLDKRREAEESGKVPKSGYTMETVDRWLRALIGDEQKRANAQTCEPGGVNAELARAIVSGGEASGIRPQEVLRRLAESLEKTEGAGQEIPAAEDMGGSESNCIKVNKPAADIQETSGGGGEDGSFRSRVLAKVNEIRAGEDRAAKEKEAKREKFLKQQQKLNQDDYADDPLGKLYERVRERLRAEGKLLS